MKMAHLPSFTPDLWPFSYGKLCKIATELPYYVLIGQIMMFSSEWNGHSLFYFRRWVDP